MVQKSKRHFRNERRRSKKISSSTNILFLTDGKETEKNYINGFIQNSKNSNQIKAKVKKVNTKELLAQAKISEFSEVNYSEIFIIFDRDEVINFNQIISEARDSGIKAFWSNPCIEIWFGEYFEHSFNKSNSKQAVQWFENIFQKQTGSPYNKSNQNIYETLVKFGNEEKAIDNAYKRLKSLDYSNKRPSELIGCTNMFELLSELDKYLK